MAVLSGVTISPVPARKFAEAIQMPGIRQEDTGWSPLSAGGKFTTRDLPTTMQEESLRASFHVYRANPLAHQLVELQTAFVIGNGITVVSEDAETLAVILDWWANPYNNWPQKLPQRLRDLYVSGEWLHWPAIGSNGEVYIRDIITELLAEILPDPRNHSEIESVVIKKYVDERQVAHTMQTIPVIRRRLVPKPGDRWDIDPKYSGDLFYFGINRTSGTTRGVSDLFPLIDYITIHDEMLIARAEKVINMSRTYWDLLLKGYDDGRINEYLARETNVPPKPGTLWAHNESAEMKAMAVDLKAADHISDIESLKSAILAGLGMPGTWFDSPGEAGRAVGAEMAESAIRRVVSLQQTLANFLRYEIDYALWAAEEFGTFKRKEKSGYALAFSRPGARDFQRIGPALARLGAFVDSVGNKYPVMEAQELRHLIATTINQLNLSDEPIKMELPLDLKLYHDQLQQQATAPQTSVDPETGDVVSTTDPVAQAKAQQALETGNGIESRSNGTAAGAR